mmetsp:Transcript_38519/g.61546  ORF Transcript_38519/g.61546 Transcript_38519/m.61546 type:complete len:136 (-) Transcript_38519:139-546(-)|eukprot:CAMPEP_0197029392 /NCGR_PEP_ID=MMETSP1384-20130603/8847_1 /TAXON_ID=29189 /ORGANISM="Ammonia sp." /LENGTH=135 /DNA_ID=CAMNT_0042458541 /DNA_START=22 /DNA_END=429 /DNA_ORIENTATION=-
MASGSSSSSNNNADIDGTIKVFKHYRKSQLGVALYDALTELVNEDVFPEELAMQAFNHYDMAMCKLLDTEVRTKIIEWHGQLAVYRFCEDVWQFFLKDAVFKTQGNPVSEQIQSKHVHIIACDGKEKKSRKRRLK